MKKDFLFVFGRDPELSFVEMLSCFKAKGKEFKVRGFFKGFALVELEERDCLKVAGELGGTVKAGEVVFKGASIGEGIKALEGAVDFSSFGKKVFFALNDLSEGKAGKEIKAVSVLLKREFKKHRIKAVEKHPRKKESFVVEPSKVRSWKLTETGLDLLVGKEKGIVLLGRTVYCSNPKGFKEREKRRPFKRELHTISIRLARILVNLSQAKRNQTVLDPFCGIGTILQEAMLTGRNAVGVEKEGTVLKKAGKNLEWAKKEFELRNEFKLMQGDSTRLSSLLKKGSFDVVVSEPYLGPFIGALPSGKEAERIVLNLEGIYSSFFKELAKTASARMRVVFVLPEIPSREGKRARVNEKVFREAGFKRIEGMGPFVYKKERNKIERLVYVLEFGNSRG